MNVKNTSKVLLIGNSFHIFHAYNKHSNENEEICALMLIHKDPFPITSFLGKDDHELPIYPISYLETVILEKHISSCILQISNLSFSSVQQLIHRILATGHCGVQFLNPQVLSMHSYKPVIIVTSYAGALGKSQVSSFMINTLTQNLRRVSVIMPKTTLIPNKHFFSKKGNQDDLSPHLEFSRSDPNLTDYSHLSVSNLNQLINSIYPEYAEFISVSDRFQIASFLRNGAIKVYYSTDINRSLISAEQFSDIIIYDCNKTDPSFVISSENYCVFTEKSLKATSPNSLIWPGFYNLLSSNVAINLETSEIGESMTPETKQLIKDTLKSNKVIFAASSFHLMTPNGINPADLAGTKMLIVEPESGIIGAGKAIAEAAGANTIDPTSILDRYRGRSVEDLRRLPVVPEDMTQFDIGSENLVNSIKSIKSSTNLSLSINQRQTTFIARSFTPTSEKEIDEMEFITSLAQESNADFILSTLQTELKIPGKRVIQAHPELKDIDNSLTKLLSHHNLFYQIL